MTMMTIVRRTNVRLVMTMRVMAAAAVAAVAEVEMVMTTAVIAKFAMIHWD